MSLCVGSMHGLLLETSSTAIIYFDPILRLGYPQLKPIDSGGLRQATLLPWRRVHCVKLIEFMKYGIRLCVRAPPDWAARCVLR